MMNSHDTVWYDAVISLYKKYSKCKTGQQVKIQLEAAPVVSDQ